MIKDQSYNPLKKCIQVYHSSRILSLLAIWYPIPILVCVLWWFSNQFAERLGDYLILVILSLFTASQFLTQIQWFIHWNRSKKAQHVLKFLENGEEMLDIDKAEKALLADKKKSSTKELLFTWFRLARIGDVSNMEAVLKNNMERENVRSQKELSVHIYINRIIMKLGFIGTLYGLVLTFEPMKRAILALKEVEGQTSFIKDIARAIDGDEYAIFSTLIATGITLVVELFNLQALERMSSRHDIAYSHLLDWNVVVLQPLVLESDTVRNREERLLEKEEILRDRKERLLEDKECLLDREVVQNQEISNQFKKFGLALERSEAQLDDLAEIQEIYWSKSR